VSVGPRDPIILCLRPGAKKKKSKYGEFYPPFAVRCSVRTLQSVCLGLASLSFASRYTHTCTHTHAHTRTRKLKRCLESAFAVPAVTYVADAAVKVRAGEVNELQIIGGCFPEASPQGEKGERKGGGGSFVTGTGLLYRRKKPPRQRQRTRNT